MISLRGNNFAKLCFYRGLYAKMCIFIINKEGIARIYVDKILRNFVSNSVAKR